MFDWLEKRKMAKIADRQRRWALLRIHAYVDTLYESGDPKEHQIGYELMRKVTALPPADFK
jgi:hypothetical protein